MTLEIFQLSCLLRNKRQDLVVWYNTRKSPHTILRFCYMVWLLVLSWYVIVYGLVVGW